MSTNNLNPADLKRLFELIIKFDRLELNQRLPGAELEKFNSLGQTKLVNALLEVSWSFGGTWATLWAICEDFDFFFDAGGRQLVCLGLGWRGWYRR